MTRIEFKTHPDFDLKTMPWFTNVTTNGERIAAQEWLFSQGMEWVGSAKETVSYGYYYLTNTMTNGVVHQQIMCAGNRGDIHNSCQEIKLTYKTTVTAVEWPTPPDTTKADKLRKKIAKLQAQLAEIEK